MTGPVYDNGTGNIFVADSNGRLSFVPDSTGVLGGTNISGLGAITDPPIVDPSTGHVFVFSGGNGTNAIVEEAGTAALGSPTSVNIGNNSATTHVHAGTFDNNYFTECKHGAPLRLREAGLERRPGALQHTLQQQRRHVGHGLTDR